MEAVGNRSKLRHLVFALLLVSGSTAPAAAQVAPPSVTSVSPVGAERGKTIQFTIEGINLKGADRILFSDGGLEGKIVSVTELEPERKEAMKGATRLPFEDIAIKYRVVAEVKIAPKTPVGRQSFRIGTALGTTNSGVFAVGALPEVAEMEPNNNASGAQKISFPITASGIIAEAGDRDVYEFEARPGQEMVFEVVAAPLQSTLDASLELLDADGTALARNKDYHNRPDPLLTYKFTRAGRYFVRVSDAFNRSGKRNFYRLNMGELPLVTSIFPLGLQKGTEAEMSLRGLNLESSKVRIKALDQTPSEATWGERISVPVKSSKGEPLNKVRAAVDPYPEILEVESNDTPATAQPITFPVTVNGQIATAKPNRESDQDFFKFTAKKNQQLTFSVAAQGLGSLLDSMIEVLDHRGQPIPRVIVRPVLETFTTLRDHDSASRGIRLSSMTGMAIGDYLMIGGELIRVEQLPESPDEDFVIIGSRGQRIGYEGTTPEAHALDAPVYKVTLHQPGTELPSGGMPPVTLTYRNDDGGPAYGKDSHLSFVAPADGEYHLRLKDVRDIGGEETHAYRLTVAEASPNYTLTVTPASPNVPLGGSVPVTVTANRIDGFDERIDVRLEGLPAGLQATPGSILPGHYSTVLTISCPAALTSNQLPPVPLRVVGTAKIKGREVSRIADPEDMISVVSVAAPPDITVAVEQKELVLKPGDVVDVTVRINRQNGFTGRVPVEVRNLPLGIVIPDVGLNGVLITESETSRTFKIAVDPNTPPLEQQLYVIGRVETNSPVASEHAAQPIKLIVAQKQPAVAASTQVEAKPQPNSKQNR